MPREINDVRAAAARSRRARRGAHRSGEALGARDGAAGGDRAPAAGRGVESEHELEARAAGGASGARCGVTRRADRGRCGLTQIRARAAPPRRSRRTRSVPPPFRARQAARRFGETARADGWLTENGVVKRRLVDEHSTARETAMRMRGEARRQFTARCSRLRAKRFRARRAASRAASRRCTTRGTSMRTTTAHIFLPAALPASRPLNPVSPLPVTLPPPARSTPAHASEMCKCARWIDDDVTRASFL